MLALFGVFLLMLTVLHRDSSTPPHYNPYSLRTVSMRGGTSQGIVVISLVLAAMC